MHSPGLQTEATSSSDDVKSRDLDPCSKEGSSSVHLLLAGVRVHAAYQSVALLRQKETLASGNLALFLKFSSSSKHSAT